MRCCPKEYPVWANLNALKPTQSQPQACNRSQMPSQNKFGQQDASTQNGPQDLNISDWMITYINFRSNRAKHFKNYENQAGSVQQGNPVSQEKDNTAEKALLPCPNI